MAENLDPFTMEALEAAEKAAAEVTHTVILKYAAPTTSQDHPVEVPAGPDSKVVLVSAQPDGLKVWVQQTCKADGTVVSDRVWLVKATETGKVMPPEWEHIGSANLTALTAHGPKSAVFHLFKLLKLSD